MNLVWILYAVALMALAVMASETFGNPPTDRHGEIVFAPKDGGRFMPVSKNVTTPVMA